MNPSHNPDPLQEPTDPKVSTQQDATQSFDAAAELIRRKLNSIYGVEPDAAVEQQQAEAVPHRSKHQQFMHHLTQSGRSLEDVQAAWHAYYANLPDQEKHEVWQEFYSSNVTATVAQQYMPAQPRPEPQNPYVTARTVANTDLQQNLAQPEPTPQYPSSAPEPVHQHQYTEPIISSMAAAEDIKTDLLKQVETRARVKKKGGILHSMAFGLGMGFLVMLVLLFGLFNERFLAPFMTPSRSVSSTPLIIDPESASVGAEPKLIIPKINVEIPVVYDEPSIQEAAVQNALERGVVHYATTSNPGELGNGAIFGHSANNILNKGKYKFAFVLLHKLEAGDTFYLEKDGKRYVYKVYEKKVVPPSEVSVLKSQGKPATFALITCDPPGTSLKRLVVYGEQISPDPLANTESTATQSTGESLPATLPSDPPSLWSRITGWFTN